MQVQRASPSHQHKERGMRGVPIENATTATDPDDGYTLGDSQDARKHADSSFTEVKISDVLAGKSKYGDSLHSVKASDSLQTAIQTMSHYNIGAILVAADDDPSAIIGIFSTRDLIRRADESSQIDTKSIKVQDLMTHSPVFAYADTNAMAAMNMMNSGGFRHLPIRDRNSSKTVGLVSIGDLVRVMMKDYADKNSYLEELVHGKYSA